MRDDDDHTGRQRTDWMNDIALIPNATHALHTQRLTPVFLETYRYYGVPASHMSRGDGGRTERHPQASGARCLLQPRTSCIMPQPHYDLLVKLLLIGDSGKYANIR